MPFRFERLGRPAALLAGASVVALTLSACKVDSRPLLARNDNVASAPAANLAYQDAAYGYGPDVYGPDFMGLPQARPARLAPVRNTYDGYALAERAYAYDRVAYQSPPDYGFRYGDEDPWAWQVADDSLMFAEPYGDDGYRFYYYEPGEQYPYFVRDPYYGYAYGDDGALSAVFSAAGALLSGTDLAPWADVAGRYLYQGQNLRSAYYRAPRYQVAEPLWVERAPIIYGYQEPWITAADTQPIWRQYRASSGQRELQAFQAERDRREQIAAQYRDRIDWNRGQAVAAQVHARNAERKFEHDQAKADRKAFRQAERREDRREVARNVYQDAHPVVARAPRIEPERREHGGGWKGEDRGERGHGGGNGRKTEDRGPQMARAQPPAAPQFRAEEHGKHDGGGDRGGGRQDNGGGNGHGGDKGGGDKGGGDKGGGHGGGHGKH